LTTLNFEEPLQELTMDNEIQLVSDGEGLAVIGDPADAKRFLVSEGLLSSSKDLGLQRLGPVLSTGAGVAQAGSEIAANSGRWVKLTEESAQAIKKFGLRESSKTGLSTGVIKGSKGQIGAFVEFVKGPGSLLTNPAILAGAAGIMAQLARQHEMNEIKDYLAMIDKKVDDVLRAQKDAELAKVIGAGLDITSAMTVRDQTGRVDAITWSTVQGRTHTITDALGWVLLRLDALAEKVESKTKVGDLAKIAKEAESEVRELLAVLARCFELQDAIDVLRLDRVLDASPDELDGHRLALNADRQDRRERVSRETERLMARMDAAVGTANSKVLLHSATSRAVVGSINHVGIAVDDFHRPLGIEFGRHSLEATRWWDAARDPRQLKNAAAEAGPMALAGVAVAALGALGVLANNATKRGE
jgi:rRNA processing protein Krr1/Pno1